MTETSHLTGFEVYPDGYRQRSDIGNVESLLIDLIDSQAHLLHPTTAPIFDRSTRSTLEVVEARSDKTLTLERTESAGLSEKTQVRFVWDDDLPLIPRITAERTKFRVNSKRKIVPATIERYDVFRADQTRNGLSLLEVMRSTHKAIKIQERAKGSRGSILALVLRSHQAYLPE